MYSTYWKNSKYWKNRQEQLIKQLEKDENKLYKKLAKEYEKTAKELDMEIALYYQKYGKNNVIEYRHLLEQLSDKDKKLLLENMDEFANKYPKYINLMPVRESIYKLDRLEGLRYSVYMQQVNLGIVQEKLIEEHLERLARNSINFSYRLMGTKTSFFNVNSESIKLIINKKWADGKNFSERIWEERGKVANYLTNEFAQHIARGDTYEKSIKELQKRFSASYKNAQRLIYTEGSYVLNEASMQPFTNGKYKSYTIVNVGDSRVCEICSDLGGLSFNIEDRQQGTNFPPFHPRCRCLFTIDLGENFVERYVEK